MMGAAFRDGVIIAPEEKFCSPCFLAPPTTLAYHAGSSPQSVSWKLTSPPPRLRYLEHRAFVGRHVDGVTLVHHHHVDVCELLGRWKVQAAIDDGTALGQHLAPVSQKLGVVVRPRAVGLNPGAYVDVNRTRVARLHRRRRGWHGRPAAVAAPRLCPRLR